MLRPLESFSTVVAVILICMAITHVVSEENKEIVNATEHVGGLKGYDDLTNRVAKLLISALEKEGKLGDVNVASLPRTGRAALEKELKAAQKGEGVAQLDASAFRLRKFAQDETDPPPPPQEGFGETGSPGTFPLELTPAHQNMTTTLYPTIYYDYGACSRCELSAGALVASVLVLAALGRP